jgi:hypothetical protein
MRKVNGLSNINKIVYASQPYKAGSKNANSWAFIIPASIVREYEIDAQTVLIMKKEAQLRRISVQILNEESKNRKMPTGKSFQASDQQAIPEIQKDGETP